MCLRLKSMTNDWTFLFRRGNSCIHQLWHISWSYSNNSCFYVGRMKWWFYTKIPLKNSHSVLSLQRIFSQHYRDNPESPPHSIYWVINTNPLMGREGRRALDDVQSFFCELLTELLVCSWTGLSRPTLPGRVHKCFLHVQLMLLIVVFWSFEAPPIC